MAVNKEPEKNAMNDSAKTGLSDLIDSRARELMIGYSFASEKYPREPVATTTLGNVR